jgi:hypothetical protein
MMIAWPNDLPGALPRTDRHALTSQADANLIVDRGEDGELWRWQRPRAVG